MFPLSWTDWFALSVVAALTIGGIRDMVRRKKHPPPTCPCCGQELPEPQKVGGLAVGAVRVPPARSQPIIPGPIPDMDPTESIRETAEAVRQTAERMRAEALKPGDCE